MVEAGLPCLVRARRRPPDAAAGAEPAEAPPPNLDCSNAGGASPRRRLCGPDDLRGLPSVTGIPYALKLATSIAAIGKEAWDACAQAPTDVGRLAPGDTSPNVEAQAYNPFTSYDFLHALEESGSVGSRSGWTPLHIMAETPDGRIAGIVPAYGKTHSQGEYVFDWGWADAFERAGGQYYPKLQVSIPFTPATGRRFLIRAGEDQDAVRTALIDGSKAAMRSIDGSSIHMTFIGQQDWERLGRQGFLQRTDQQFHWLNEGYGTFDDFLAALASRKRKTIKRERRDALANGISIERLTGAAITEEAWDAFYAF